MKLFMSDAEIASHYRQAADKQKDLKILAELNACGITEIKAALSRENISEQNQRPKLDAIVAKKLYDQGRKDSDIAAALNVSRQAISNWRRRNHLPSNQRKKESQKLDVHFQEIARNYDIAKRILALIPQGASPKVKSCAIDLICALLEAVVEELVNHDIPEQ